MHKWPSLGVVGAGKVGSTLARLWYGVGYRIAAVYSPTLVHARTLAEQVNAATSSSPSGVLAEADLTLLTVPDDRIEFVAEGLKNREVVGKAVIHTSGVHDSGALASLAERGAVVGSLHPVFPFADVEMAVARLPGSAFAVEADTEPLRQWLIELVLALDGHVLLIPTGRKALYHAALAIASNYMVTLYAVAEELLLQLGLEHKAANHALNTLVAATVENLQSQGIPGALTGPLVRADISTISAHLEALGRVEKRLKDIYVSLARLSFPMLQVRGVSPEPIERILSGQEDQKCD
jgi:predicted short-subunit dehydrogenase-like oxidoreductase (DUF2520 family)